MGKKKNEAKMRELGDISQEVRKLERSLDFKENLVAGIISGVVVTLFFTISDYATRFGLTGFLVFIFLMIVGIRLFTLKEEKTIKRLKKRLAEI